MKEKVTKELVRNTTDEDIAKLISFINDNFNNGNKKTNLENYKIFRKYITEKNVYISLLDAQVLYGNCDKIKEMFDNIFDDIEATNNLSTQSLLSIYIDEKYENEDKNTESQEYSDGAIYSHRYNEKGIDLTKLYFNEISRFDILSVEKEKELGLKKMAGDKLAYEKLVNHNLKLAAHYAKMYLFTGVSFMDLVQAANEGLLKAVDRYDPSKGFKFSTYATYWIRQSIQRSIADTNRTIRIPVHMHEITLKMKRAIVIYGQENNGEMPSDEYLAEVLNLPIQTIKTGFDAMSSIMSLSNPVGEDDGSSELGELIEDTAFTTDDIIDSEFYSSFRKLLNETNAISDKEREVLKYRFGFYNDKIYTLEEIGKMFHVTRERIRQIEKRALRILKNNIEVKGYSPNGYNNLYPNKDIYKRTNTCEKEYTKSKSTIRELERIFIKIPTEPSKDDFRPKETSKIEDETMKIGFDDDYYMNYYLNRRKEINSSDYYITFNLKRGN